MLNYLLLVPGQIVIYLIPPNKCHRARLWAVLHGKCFYTVKNY